LTEKRAKRQPARKKSPQVKKPLTQVELHRVQSQKLPKVALEENHEKTIKNTSVWFRNLPYKWELKFL
jgi:hypothetical protein